MISRVVATKEEVDRVRLAGTERLGKGAADPRCGCRWAERVVVANLEEADIALDKFRELDCVACSIIRDDYEEMERTDLVLQSRP